MKSVRNRLFVMLLLFIILPYFLSVFIIYLNTKERIEEQELKKSREELQESGEAIQRQFDEYLKLPYSLVNAPDVFPLYEKGWRETSTERVQAFERGIVTFSSTRPEIRQLRFYFHQDQQALTVYQSKLSAPKERQDYMEQPVFSALASSGTDSLIEPPHRLQNDQNVAIIPESDTTTVLTFHHKVRDVLSGDFLGFLSFDVDVVTLAPTVGRMEEAGADIYLLDRQRTVMFSDRSGEIGSTLPAATLSDERQKGRMVLTRTLGEPLQSWQLVKIISTDALFRDAREAAITNVWLGLGVVILGVLMVIVISRIITRPIIELSDKVRAIEGSDVKAALTTGRRDEIGYLETQMESMLNRIHTHIEREYKLDIEVKRSQMRLLKSQVNPHFLFNALQSIGAVALRSDAPDVYGLLTKLSSMMRYSLQADQLVAVKQEMDYIESYVALQKERFGEAVHVKLHVAPDMLHHQIPSMTIQPLVENYFKHTYEGGYDDATLTITGKKTGEYLHFTVENDGSTVSEGELEALNKSLLANPSSGSSKGIGLKNISDRLRLHYQHDAVFKLDRMNGNGFAVHMMIPLNENQ